MYSSFLHVLFSFKGEYFFEQHDSKKSIFSTIDSIQHSAFLNIEDDDTMTCLNTPKKILPLHKTKKTCLTNEILFTCKYTHFFN